MQKRHKNVPRCLHYYSEAIIIFRETKDLPRAKPSNTAASAISCRADFICILGQKKNNFIQTFHNRSKEQKKKDLLRKTCFSLTQPLIQLLFFYRKRTCHEIPTIFFNGTVKSQENSTNTGIVIKKNIKHFLRFLSMIFLIKNISSLRNFRFSAHFY